MPMIASSAWILVGTVGAVGVLHTIVPDHWVPLTVIARQRGWSAMETARAAFQAGLGHVLSTLVIAVVVWGAGLAFAQTFGTLVDLVSGFALVAFGGWIAISGWREMLGGGHGHSHHPHGHGHGDHGHRAHGHHHHDHEDDHGHHHDDAGQGRDHDRVAAAPGVEAKRDPLYLPLRGGLAVAPPHAHLHRHGRGSAHLHWHDHSAGRMHPEAVTVGGQPPLHEHRHRTDARTALLLILGSSPMVEGIPAFFAAGKYGPALIGLMAAVFALSTIATYIALCLLSTAGLQRIQFGALERYGEVGSGAVVALVGAAFLIWPIA
jgi:ABC-type nickel/cobalt efflux system permease component RcnA